jgi:hypothetical protein
VFVEPDIIASDNFCLLGSINGACSGVFTRPHGEEKCASEELAHSGVERGGLGTLDSEPDFYGEARLALSSRVAISVAFHLSFNDGRFVPSRVMCGVRPKVLPEGLNHI